MLKDYLEKIAKVTSQGDAREESYYSQLEEMLAEYAIRAGKKKVHITTIPKATEAGNPDFRIWDGKQHIVGYVEAKAPHKNLDEAEASGQLQRYRETFPNLILTNFYEFRLYRDGNLTARVLAGRAGIAESLKITPPVEQEGEFENLLQQFFDFSLPKTFTASSLAAELAKRTSFLKDEILVETTRQQAEGGGDVFAFYELFTKYLIAHLTVTEFADLYAQTITYGLFASRTRANDEFNRKTAFLYIPATIGILKDFFQYISFGKVPLAMQIIIDDLAEVLLVADINSILHQFYKEGKGNDPIIHFYDTFLGKYDPKLKERRGVYYTPEPVVGYIVRSVHQLLKSRFELSDGLASEEVTLLDPAAGTVTFPAEAIRTAIAEYIEKYGRGGVTHFIRNHILKNFYAFELMMAPYAIGHLKIGFVLEEFGYKMSDDERFKLYLTNTLETDEIEQINIPILSALSEESRLAGDLKRDEPILVILGNPPYSGESANRNDWTERLLKQDIDGAQSYYKVDDLPLGEKNPKWLQDDYVKFLRFAQWKIHKAGQGIVGMITNHGYLDNPTFRGMRQSLMNTFNEIYIVDLHGNSKKKETAPDGSKDVNVFDIQQGTAIALMLKRKGQKGCKVYQTDVYGLREDKHNWLNQRTLSRKDYELLKPDSPHYFFIKRATKEILHYLNWRSINEMFPVNSVGIVTARDEFVISVDKNSLLVRIKQFLNPNLSDEIVAKSFNLANNSKWNISKAREDALDIGLADESIKEILYRPFDKRFIFYHKSVIERTRSEVMDNMLTGKNIGLVCVRQVAEGVFNHALISNTIIESRVTLSNKGISYFYPLYIYPKKTKKKRSSPILYVMEPQETYGRKANLDEKFEQILKTAYHKKISPEQILYYVYAVLYSNVYREKYAEFLRIDFPKVPFPKEYKLFRKFSGLGAELAALHLLESRKLDKPIAKYEGEGNNDLIDKVAFSGEDNRVYLNSNKYFEGITEELWGYQVGGYQVLEKYLKVRKGRLMDDPRQYCRIVTAISETIALQQEIDNLYPEIEKDPMDTK